MIDDLDKTVETLLKRELPDLFGDVDGRANGQVDISFATPDDKFASSRVKPTMNLFLYDIQENLNLRTSERMAMERHNTSNATQKRPPVQVDFSYMITAWSSEKSEPPPVFDEHRLLSAIMHVLLRYPAIPQEMLQGELKELESLPRAFVLQPIRLQSMGEFWQALGGKPKAAINYTVTVSVDAHKPIDVGLVQELLIGYQRKDTLNQREETRHVLSIVGQVTGAETQKALAGAQVSITDRPEQTFTSADGFFRFVDLPDGTYTLKTSVRGYQAAKEEVTVARGEQGKVVIHQTDFALKRRKNYRNKE